MTVAILLLGSQFSLLVTMYFVNRRVDLAHSRIDYAWLYAREVHTTATYAHARVDILIGDVSSDSVKKVIEDHRKETAN